MGLGILQKTIVGKQSLSLHLQIQVKTQPSKKKAMLRQYLIMLPTFLESAAHLRWTDREWKSVRVHIFNCFWK